MRALTPFVVRVPSSKVRGGADVVATHESLAIEVPTSATVETVIVAPTPLPSVVVA